MRHAAVPLLAALLAATAFAPLASAGLFEDVFGPAPEATARPAPAASEGLRFGVGVSGLDDAERLGWDPDYAQTWVGSWSRDHGWFYLRWAMDKARDHGATPVVEWYYWGDDIAPACFDVGCDGKSVAEWHRMGRELATVVRRDMDRDPAIIVVETEFNKNGVDETFDPLLAEHVRMLKRLAPNAEVLVGFGAWGADGYARFDEAMDAADGAGLQLLRAATRDGADDLREAPSDLLHHVRALDEAFGKPVLLHDLAVSTWGGNERAQADVLEGIGRVEDDLVEAGLVGVVWRSLQDSPLFRTTEYFGVAERHWGLLDEDGRAKPGLGAWLRLVGARDDAGAHPFGDAFAWTSPFGGAAWWW